MENERKDCEEEKPQKYPADGLIGENNHRQQPIVDDAAVALVHQPEHDGQR